MSAAMTRRNLLQAFGLTALALAAPPILSDAAQAQPVAAPLTGTERRVERRVGRTERRQYRRIRRVDRRRIRREGRVERRAVRREGREIRRDIRRGM